MRWTLLSNLTVRRGSPATIGLGGTLRPSLTSSSRDILIFKSPPILYHLNPQNSSNSPGYMRHKICLWRTTSTYTSTGTSHLNIWICHIHILDVMLTSIWYLEQKDILPPLPLLQKPTDTFETGRKVVMLPIQKLFSNSQIKPKPEAEGRLGGLLPGPAVCKQPGKPLKSRCFGKFPPW